MINDIYTPMPLRFTTSGEPDGPFPEPTGNERDYLTAYPMPQHTVPSQAAWVNPETVFWTILFAGSLIGIYLSFRTF